MAKIITMIATLGFIGYLPAPGTMATVVAVPFGYLLSLLPFSWQIFIIFIFHGIGLFIIEKALLNYLEADPKQIVFDEFVGTLVTFLGIVYHPTVFCAGFILFRLFDIFKLFGIKHIEKLPGAYGVLLDDSIAGLFANCILRCLFI